MKFIDHLLLLFLYQPKPDYFVFENAYFDIYKYLLIKWKHGIYMNNIVTFNESIENLSMSNIEPKNIDESSHEDEVVFLNMQYIDIYIYIM